MTVVNIAFGACIDNCQCPASPSGSLAAAAAPGTDQSQLDELLAQMVALLNPHLAGPELPANVQIELELLLSQADSVVGGDIVDDFYASLAVLEQTTFIPLDQQAGPIRGNMPPYPVPYVAIVVSPTEGFVFRGETGASGRYQLFIPRNARILSVHFFDPVASMYGEALPVASRAQLGYGIHHPYLVNLDGSEPDSDSDGLADVVEIVLGTDSRLADTDGDGILDGAEVEQGTDPLDGLIVQIGIIATADTPGTAADICAVNDIVIVADTGAGISVFNVFNGMDPTTIAQVDTPVTCPRPWYHCLC